MTLGFQKSSSKTQQFSGLRGTPYQGEAETRANRASQIGQGWTEQVLRDPLRYRGQSAEMLNPMGRWGMGLNVDRAADEFATQVYGKASATGARMGRLTPEGSAAAAGDAITHALPMLIPNIQAFQQWQFEQPMSLNQYASALANQNVDTQMAGLGSEGRGSSSGMGVQFSLKGNERGTIG